MKRNYVKPSLSIWQMEPQYRLMTTSDPETDTQPVYDDDPQDPGNALARRHDLWQEYEENELYAENDWLRCCGFL